MLSETQTEHTNSKAIQRKSIGPDSCPDCIFRPSHFLTLPAASIQTAWRVVNNSLHSLANNKYLVYSVHTHQ